MEHGLKTRYRLLETIRQYGEQRLGGAGEAERWRASHAGYYAGVLARVREHAHDPNQEVFWAVRLSAEQENLLAGWSWAIGADNVGTAFAIMAGFAPSEVWITYPLALAVSALFASIRADVTGAEKLWRRAAEANAAKPPQTGGSRRLCAPPARTSQLRAAFADAARLAEQAADIARADGDLADASLQLAAAVANHLLAGGAPGGVPLAREALVLAARLAPLPDRDRLARGEGSRRRHRP